MSESIVDVANKFRVHRCPWCGNDWPPGQRDTTCPFCMHTVERAGYNDMCPLCGGDWREGSCHQALLVRNLSPKDLQTLHNYTYRMTGLMRYPDEPGS